MKAIKLICVGLTLVLIISKHKIKWNKYLNWLLITAALAVCSYFWALSKEFAFDGLKTVLLNSLCLFSIVELIYMSTDWQSVVYNSLSWGPALRLLYLIFQYGFSIFEGIRNIEGVNYNNIGMHAGLGVAFSILSYLHYLKKYGKVNNIYWVPIILDSFIAMLSMSRKSLVYLILPVILYYILANKNWLKAVRNVIFVSVGLVVVYFSVMNIPVLYNYIGNGLSSLFEFWSTKSGDASVAGRMTRIGWGLNWFSERPIVGYGVMNYNYMFGQVEPFSDMVIADNNFIDLLVSYGVIGTVLYYFIYVRSLCYAIANRKKELKQKSMALAILLTLLICDYGSSSYIYLHSQLYLAIAVLILYEDDRRFALKTIKF